MATPCRSSTPALLLALLIPGLFCLATLTACGNDRGFSTPDPEESDAAAHKVITVNGRNIPVAVRNTVEGRRQGLMHRTALKPGEGMLFVYPEPKKLSFWMKNTHVPLSIAFIDADGIIVNIERMDPQSRWSHVAEREVPYALEVLQGWFEVNDIGPGDKVLGLEGLRDDAEPDPPPPDKPAGGDSDG